VTETSDGRILTWPDDFGAVEGPKERQDRDEDENSIHNLLREKEKE